MICKISAAPGRAQKARLLDPINIYRGRVFATPNSGRVSRIRSERRVPKSAPFRTHQIIHACAQLVARINFGENILYNLPHCPANNEGVKRKPYIDTEGNSCQNAVHAQSISGNVIAVEFAQSTTLGDKLCGISSEYRFHAVILWIHNASKYLLFF